MEIDDWLVEKGKNRRRYDWDKYFDGKLHILTQGKDFTTDFHTFYSTAYAASRRLGLKVRIHCSGKEVAIQKVSDDHP